ncbi:MAG: sensor histidine kinase [Candidatus Saccharicenans sp.]|nr:MAG: hypothetical protein C0168_01980 [Candidatus Aminicenantes bacterium]HEK85848.1 PAS domain S-box protein [Candidatus Aminicenantes bacterium]
MEKTNPRQNSQQLSGKKLSTEQIAQTLVKNSPYGLVLIDSSGRWLLANPAFTELTGYSLEDIPEGKSWFEKAFPDSETREKIMELWKKDWKERKTKDREFEIVRKDGQKKWIGMRATFLPDGQIVMAFHDLTERKALEKAQEKSESYYRALLEAIPDMVVITDPDGIITYASDSVVRYFGYDSAEEIIGRNNQDFFAPEEVERIQQIGSFIQAQGYLSPLIAAVIKKDGTRRIVELSSSSIRDHNSQVIGYIGIFRDITERIELEKNLREMLKEKEVLIREINHRVKNNLQLIHSLLRLQYHQNPNPEVKAALKDTQSRVRAISLIYESLMRAEHLDRINLKLYVDKIVTHLASVYQQKEKPIKIILDLEEIYADISKAHPCGLIVSELISNSLKHAFPGNSQGTITISLHRDKEGKVILSVADDGIGLPADFNFTELDSLGGQIINDLVRQINGSLSSHTEPGRGTEIKITFMTGTD